MATAILVPGSYEPEPEAGEVERGLVEFENYLQTQGVEQIRDVGRGVIAIEERGLSRGIGHVASSAFIVPSRSQPREVSPGVYYF